MSKRAFSKPSESTTKRLREVGVFSFRYMIMRETEATASSLNGRLPIIEQCATTKEITVPYTVFADEKVRLAQALLIVIGFLFCAGCGREEELPSDPSLRALGVSAGMLTQVEALRTGQATRRSPLLLEVRLVFDASLRARLSMRWIDQQADVVGIELITHVPGESLSRVKSYPAFSRRGVLYDGDSTYATDCKLLAKVSDEDLSYSDALWRDFAEGKREVRPYIPLPRECLAQDILVGVYDNCGNHSNLVRCEVIHDGEASETPANQ